MANQSNKQHASAPLVMDVKRPASDSTPIAPDHQLTEHGTPDVLPTAVAPDPDALLQQVAAEQPTTLSAPHRAPVGLIIVSIIVVILLSVISWFALQVEL